MFGSTVYGKKDRVADTIFRAKAYAVDKYTVDFSTAQALCEIFCRKSRSGE